ncbi:MAG: hypothetical protein WCL27_16240 [Betaproteobacteria bacterium]
MKLIAFLTLRRVGEVIAYLSINGYGFDFIAMQLEFGWGAGFAALEQVLREVKIGR